MSRRIGLLRRGSALLALIGCLAGPIAATQVKIFSASSPEAFLAGTLDGISVDPLGILRLADRAERLTAIDEPFLLSAVASPEGWVLGTGNAGRVLAVDRSGAVRTLFEAEESEVFAVWVDDADGTVYAGSSPKGKVYRYRDGEAEVFFDPEQTYIWALARSSKGSLLVATGTEGKLFEVDADGTGTLLYDSSDTHLRALQPLEEGGALIGTAGEGLILTLDAEGGARTLFDANQPEIVAFAVGEGRYYAAALASEASRVDLSKSSSSSGSGGSSSSGSEGSAANGSSEGQVTVSEGSVSAGSRPSGFTGARSEVLSITPQGAVESVWKFQAETVYALHWHRERLWVGTGLEGKLFSLRGDRMVLEKDVDERQVVAFLRDEPGPAFATTNAAAVYRLTGGTERRGHITSAVLDAGQMARFGTLHWEGDLPRGTRVELSVRSGMSSEPDATWSPWVDAREGQEIDLSPVVPGRYLQWRATLVAKEERSPLVRSVEISYLQQNQKPEIGSLNVLEPGKILVPSNFNPSNQAFEPAHPSRDGIFTTLRAATDNSESNRKKALWKLGYRTLEWTAVDPNEDELRYRISFRRETSETWLPIVDDLEESFYSFDATVLPDGRYRFRLEASDRPGNLEADALVAERVSESVVIDHGVPELETVRRRGESLEVEVRDAFSPLREAAYSVDAGKWRPVRVVDGILDGRRESLDLVAAEGSALVLLRIKDAAHNVVTFDLSDDGARAGR